MSHKLNSARRYWRDNFTKFDHVFVSNIKPNLWFVSNIKPNLPLTPPIIRVLWDNDIHMIMFNSIYAETYITLLKEWSRKINNNTITKLEFFLENKIH